MSRTPLVERDARLFALARAGKTVREIANETGLSLGHVRYVVGRARTRDIWDRERRRRAIKSAVNADRHSFTRIHYQRQMDARRNP